MVLPTKLRAESTSAKVCVQEENCFLDMQTLLVSDEATLIRASIIRIKRANPTQHLAAPIFLLTVAANPAIQENTLIHFQMSIPMMNTNFQSEKPVLLEFLYLSSNTKLVITHLGRVTSSFIVAVALILEPCMN